MTVESLMAWQPQRDRWGRPIIDGTPYTRMSTLAKALDKGEALTKWKQRQTAVGLSQRPDLVALVSSSGENKRTLDDACEQALVQAQSNLGANLGTALHSFTEIVDAGGDPKAPEELKGDLAAYSETMAKHKVKILSSEQFVVVDEIECAGTYDRLVEFDGRLMVADIKTGQYEPRYPHSATIQTAGYSRGVPFSDKGRGTPLPQAGVDQDQALLIWLPSRQAKCELYLLDIKSGWSMARVAAGVRRWHKARPIQAV